MRDMESELIRKKNDRQKAEEDDCVIINIRAECLVPNHFVIGERVYINPQRDNQQRPHPRAGVVRKISSDGSFAQILVKQYNQQMMDDETLQYNIGDVVYIISDDRDIHSGKTGTVAYVNKYGKFVGIRIPGTPGIESYFPYQICKAAHEKENA